MSKEIPQNLDDHIVREFTSDTGEKYAVAYPKGAGDTNEALESELDSSEKEHERREGTQLQLNRRAAQTSSDSGWVTVKWSAGHSYPGYSLPKAVTDIGISEVSIGTWGANWSYNLHFKNTKGWGFQFKDATGDVYRISTIRNGPHYLLYNSKDPTIVGVK